MIVLNIGLESDKDYPPSARVAESLRLSNLYVEAKRYRGKVYLQHSLTKPTVVIELSHAHWLDWQEARSIAEYYHQRCIAVWDTIDHKGELIGPNVGSNVFLEPFFIMPDGRTLEQHNAQFFRAYARGE